MISLENIEKKIIKEKLILKQKSKNYKDNFLKIEKFIEEEVLKIQALKKNNSNLNSIPKNFPINQLNKFGINFVLTVFGSVASEITFRIQNEAFDYLDAPIKRITTADTPAPYSPTLLEKWIPKSNDVIKAVKEVLYK